MPFLNRTSPYLAGLAAAAMLLCAAMAPAQARDRMWYLGGGLVSSSLSGDLDQNDVFFDASGTTVFGADVERGSGAAVQGGFMPSPHFGLELLFGVSGHDASTSFLPGESLEASLATLLFSGLGVVPLDDGLELFGRAGLGFYDLVIENNAADASGTVRDDSSFSGRGIGLGGGAMLLLGRVGLELGYTLHLVNLDRLDVDGTYGSIPDQNLRVGTVHLTVTFHFGREIR